MKVAIITDTHFGARKGSQVFHEFFQKFYDDIFFPTLEERGIKACIHMGDAFDNRKNIDFWALNWARKNVYDKFKKLGVKVYQLVGNHDVYYKNTNEIILSSKTSLYSCPEIYAKELLVLDIGTTLSILRNWKVSKSETWVRVELASNKFLDDPNRVLKGWIKM